MTTCEDCGGRVYSLGCVNCNEDAYIKEQAAYTEEMEARLAQEAQEQAAAPPPAETGGEECFECGRLKCDCGRFERGC